MDAGQQFAATLSRTAVESMTPLIRDQIVPMVLRDTYALTTVGVAAGQGAVREAGVFGAIAAIGIGAAGAGLLLWGSAKLYTALRER